MTPADLNQLIDALLEGDISEADFLRLEAEFSVDPEARRSYYERLKLSVLLENLATQHAIADPRTASLPVFEANDKGRWKWAFAVMAAIAAALLVMTGWQWLSPAEYRPRAEAPASSLPDGKFENAVTGFAVIAGQADAVWANQQQLTNGGVIPPGELQLRSGIVQLELFSGVQLVIEGEAAFSVLSPMEVSVTRGKLRARVPEPAHGFRIRTAEGEVVDLGTEFAVNVTDESSEVHVLDGEIEWIPHGATPQRMERGAAIRLARDGRSLATTPSAFVDTGELQSRLEAKQQARLEAWRLSSQELRNDPRLVAYYQVAHSDLATRRLTNLATHGESSPGAVVAAGAAPGRWGQSGGALDFSPAGSRVRLSVPGEHRSLSLLCWVKIHSLDRWYNSLFLTDGHEQGEPHWQIMDDGRLFFSVKKRDVFDRDKGEMDKHIYYSPPFWDTALSGQWLMLATTYDVDQRQVTHFLNGQVLSREAIPDEYLVDTVRIGNASLCNWGMPSRDQPSFAVRNLNGSLDEFALFDAALTATEIRKLYEAGKP